MRRDSDTLQMLNTSANKSDRAIKQRTDDAIESEFGATDLWLLLMTIIWGANFTIIKYSLEDMIPLTFTGLRFVLASFVMLILMRARRRQLAVTRADLKQLFGLGILSTALYQPLFIIGMSHTRAGNAALILSAAPLFTAVIGRLRKQEYFSSRGVIGLLMAFSGIALIILAGHKEIRFDQSLLGDGLLVGATVCWSLYTVGSKGLVHKHGSLKATTIMMTTSTPVLLLICAPAFLAQDWSRARAVAWGGLIYSALLAIALAYIIWNHGVRKIGPTRTAVYSNLTPIVALIVAWPALGEAPTWGQIAGAIIIFTGIYLARRGMIRVAPREAVIDQVEEASLKPGSN